jgi:hypothetical protein
MYHLFISILDDQRVLFNSFENDLIDDIDMEVEGDKKTENENNSNNNQPISRKEIKDNIILLQYKFEEWKTKNITIFPSCESYLKSISIIFTSVLLEYQ